MPISSKKAPSLSRRFSTPMLQCNQMGDHGYSCMALLPGTKHEGYTELELKAIENPRRSSNMINSVYVNDIAIESKKFQMSRYTEIKCKLDFMSTDLHCN